MRGGAKFSFVESKMTMGQAIGSIQKEQTLSSSESSLWATHSYHLTPTWPYYYAPFLQLRKMRHREIKLLSQDHMALKSQAPRHQVEVTPSVLGHVGLRQERFGLYTQIGPIRGIWRLERRRLLRKHIRWARGLRTEPWEHHLIKAGARILKRNH